LAITVYRPCRLSRGEDHRAASSPPERQIDQCRDTFSEDILAILEAFERQSSGSLPLKTGGSQQSAKEFFGRFSGDIEA